MHSSEPSGVPTVPHAEFVTSCIVAAVNLHFRTTLARQNQPHPLTLHLIFLRRTSVGPVTIEISDVKLGQRTSNVHITLTQDNGREEVVGHVIQGNISLESGITLPTRWTLDPAPYSIDVSKLAKDKDINWRLERNYAIRCISQSRCQYRAPPSSKRPTGSFLHRQIDRLQARREIHHAGPWIRGRHVSANCRTKSRRT